MNQFWPRSKSPYGITSPQWSKAYNITTLFHIIMMLHPLVTSLTMKIRLFLLVYCMISLSISCTSHGWGNMTIMHCELAIMGLNTLGYGQNGQHFADNTLKCTFLNKKYYILIGILIKYVYEGPIHNKSVLVSTMAGAFQESTLPSPSKFVTHLQIYENMTCFNKFNTDNKDDFISQW